MNELSGQRYHPFPRVPEPVHMPLLRLVQARVVFLVANPIPIHKKVLQWRWE
jgi:hypothetical protein